MTERIDLAKALTDLNSCILGMMIAHGRNPMADSILDRHAAIIEKAPQIALGFDEAPRPEENATVSVPRADLEWLVNRYDVGHITVKEAAEYGYDAWSHVRKWLSTSSPQKEKL